MSIYKYVVKERLDVLRGGYIRFSQPSVLNDPYEGRPYVERFTSREDMENKVLSKLRNIDFMEFLEQFTDEAMKMPQVSQFRLTRAQVRELVAQMIRENREELAVLRTAAVEMMDETMERLQPEMVEKLPAMMDEHVGVLCLTEACDDRLMWAHYTADHTGFVIEFDERHHYFGPVAPEETESEEAPLLGLLRKVRYSVDIPSYPVLVREDLDFRDAFFVKDAAWAYEREWRMLRLLPDADRTIDALNGKVHLFALPPECVTGVILGCRADPQTRREVAEFLDQDPRYQHVVLKQVVRDSKAFGLRIEPV